MVGNIEGILCVNGREYGRNMVGNMAVCMYTIENVEVHITGRECGRKYVNGR